MNTPHFHIGQNNPGAPLSLPSALDLISPGISRGPNRGLALFTDDTGARLLVHPTYAHDMAVTRLLRDPLILTARVETDTAAVLYARGDAGIIAASVEVRW